MTDLMSIDDLADHCAHETQKYRRRQSSDPQYCFELLRRALADNLPDALTRVYQIYQSQVRKWIYSHSLFIQTDEDVDFFVNAALNKFYFALRGEKFRAFAALPSVLSYLKMCVHTVIAQYLRDQRSRTNISLDGLDEIIGYNPALEAAVGAEELWTRVCHLLPDESDLMLAHYVFIQNLKPADIIERSLGPWSNAREISVSLQRIRRILRTDFQIRQWAGFELESS